ncbi:urea ABC transporter permease subunit UrtB [Halothiobacillus sp. DCM-1]|uniref:urea ABC transporter permease subunit UrtB n=1 Tax=Halothiobacillus sp. DCM-1 TaxID=3112558 RepID=UPI003243D899
MNTQTYPAARWRWAGLVLAALLGTAPVQAEPIAHAIPAPSNPSQASDPAATPQGLAPGSALLEALAEGGMRRSQALSQWIEHPPASTADQAALRALNHDHLYIQTTPPARLGIRQEGDRLIDPTTGQLLGKADDSGWEKISLNNAIRIKLRPRIDLMDLTAADPATRHAAAEDLFSARLTPAYIQEIKTLLPNLAEPETQAKLKQLVAGFELTAPDPATRLTAIAGVADALDPEIRARLAPLAASDPDPAVRAAAQKALNHIDQRVAAWQFGQNLVFGLSLGSVLLLSAIGLAITFGVMGVINMAHGEMMMIGAYTTWVLQQLLPQHLTAALLLAIPAAFVVAGLVGIAIERGLIRFLYGRPLETLLATFGLSLILQQAARLIFTPLNRAVALPEFMQNSWVLNPVFAITYNRLYILIFSLMVFFALLLLLKRSTFGLRIRAVAQNRQMARACGVRSGWIDALTFGLGSGIAGVAGVALALITNVGPNLGQNYIVDSFMVVVLGGVGNLWGTLVAGMGIGVLNKFLEPYAGAVLAKVVVLVLVILVIQKRPRGLFPQKGRAAEE